MAPAPTSNIRTIASSHTTTMDDANNNDDGGGGGVDAAEASSTAKATMPSANELRLLANSRFASNALDEALPLYGMAVDAAARRYDAAVVGVANDDNNDGDDDCNNGGNESGVEGEVLSARDDLVVHLCNRSACRYKMEMYDEARADAAEAVRLGSLPAGRRRGIEGDDDDDGGGGGSRGGGNLKAHFRLARAQIALGEYDDAVDTIGKAAILCDAQLKGQRDDSGGTAEENDDDDATAAATTAETTNDNLLLQKREFEKLLTAALRKRSRSDARGGGGDRDSPRRNQPHTAGEEAKSIKRESRTPSVREFDRPSKTSDAYRPLGEGNFSTVVVCRHKFTGEEFALKIIEKEECKKLAKRQHPNVFNEVAMERRVLAARGRLPGHANVVRCYHAMQGES